MSSVREKLRGKTTKLSQPRESLDDHPASIDNYADGSFYHIEIDVIHPDPNQPRKDFDAAKLEELSITISERGVLQPVLVRKDEANEIWLVAGERRFRASKMAGLKKIPAIFTTGNPSEIALIENLQRENLNPIEEADALDRMIKEFNYTHEQLAKVVGKARNTVTQILSLTKLPEAIKRECPRADISKRVLIEIARQESQDQMLDLFKKVQDGELKRNEVRNIARKKARSVNRSALNIAVEKTAFLAKYLRSMNLDLNVTEDMQLIAELKNLKTVIDEILN